MTVIGSAYVNIRAITDKLESDIRTAIESIKDSVTLTVDADVSSATAKLDELADASLSDKSLNVDADTSSAQEKLEEIAQTVLGDQVIRVSADTSSAHSALLDIANIAGLERVVPVTADTLEARSQLDDMMDDIDGASPIILPDVDSLWAEARLAILTRAREIRINLKMNSGPLAAVANTLSRMSGARVLVDDIGKLTKHFINIDKAVPGIAKMATIFGSIGGAIVSSIGGLSTLGASLGSIINMAAIAAPGMATGFMVGIGTLIVALKDFKNQLPGVVAQYKTLGATIKTNFWAEARDSIENMATTLFPMFNEGLAQTSGALGRWATTFADAIRTAFEGNQIMPAMFRNLTESIDIAKGANADFVESMVTIGYAGSGLLPRLAGWWTDVADRFNNFIQTADSNGDLQRWIEEGITNLKRLGSVIGETSGIFGGITEAARMAGSDGLGTLLGFVTRVNDAINSPEGLKALSTIFSGANTVATALGDAFFQIMGALGTAAPAIKSAFESVGGVINVVSDAISKVISNPEFQAGFVAMFDGIEKGFGALMPVVGEMGPKFGAFLSIIGSLAANIGGVLGAALEVALPLVTSLKEAIDPLIPVIGEALISAIQALAPTFDMLAATISTLAPVVLPVVSFIADLVVGLIEGLGPALPGIVAAVAALVVGFQAFGAATAVVGTITSIGKGAFATGQLLVGLSKNFGIMKFAIQGVVAGMNLLKLAFLANPIGIIVGAIAALVAGFVLAYNNIGWFKDGVDAAMKWIGEAVGNVVNFWNDNVIPMFGIAGQAVADFFGGIGRWIGEAVTNVQNFFGGFGKGAGEASGAVGDFVGGIGDSISGAFSAAGDWFAGIGQGISDAFNGVTEFVGGVMEAIGGFLQERVDNIISNWTAAWNIVTEVFTNIWNGLVWFFQPLVDLIVSIIRFAVDVAVAIWTTGWNLISLIFQGIWQNLVSFFTPILQGIADFITNTVNGIVAVWNAVWQAIGDFFVSIWNNMVAFYGPILQGIWDFIVSVGAGISAAWNAAWQAIGDFFVSIWNNMVAFYGPILQSIWDFIVSVGAGIAAAWNAIWSGISSFFIGLWNGIVSFVSGAISGIASVISGVIAGISAAWNATWSAISGFVSGVWRGIVSAVSGFVGQVQQNVQNVLTSVGNIGSDILGKVGNFGSLLVQSGRDLISGLTNGIDQARQWVIDKITSIGQAAESAIKNFFGIKSPSRKMRDEVGKMIGAGLAIGIEQSVAGVAKAANKLAEAAMPDISDIQLPTITGGGVVVGTAGLSLNPASSMTQPVLTRNSVFSGDAAVRNSDAFRAPLDGTPAPNVSLTINPSQGLSEEQIGEAAVKELYWQLINR